MRLPQAPSGRGLLWGASAACVFFGALQSCRCGAPSQGVPAGADVVDIGAELDVTVPLSVSDQQNAVAVVGARLHKNTGGCAQVRSVKDKVEAEAAAAAITAETTLPVELFEKDLGARGIWWRLCVGDEESPARVTARALKWTAPGGILEKFLDPPNAGEPRFFALEKAGTPRGKATLEQARALLMRSRVGDVVFAGTEDRPLLAGTGPSVASAGGLVVVDVDGHLLSFDKAPAPGCAACALAEQKNAVISRRVLAAGNVFPAAGDELLIEEETSDATRTLAVVVAEHGVLRRVGAVLLASASASVILRGEASVVEADGDYEREVAIARLELRTSGNNLCALETHAEAWGSPSIPTTATATTATTPPAGLGLVKLNALTLAQQEGGDEAVVDFVTAMDGAGDKDTASRACASVLADHPSPLLSQLCLQRIRTLVADGRVIKAVNAAGTLSEGTPALRAAVATPLFQAMTVLDQDPRLSAAPWDCASEPLVKDIASKSFDDILKMARLRLGERLSIADVNDAVFVTAVRDFGPDTPVGQIAARWLERLRVVQAARHAAIEALLLPQEPQVDAADAGTEFNSGFGGRQ